MMKSISYRLTLCISVLFSIANLSADTLTVTWTGAIGELETTIMADTSADGTQAHDVYKLEANKVYLQRSTLILESSCDIVGAAYGTGEAPATIQPIPGDDGASQFAGWPAGNIKTYGEDQSYAFKNLLFNGVFADGSGTLFGVLATYGKRNTITVDHVTSVHNEVITYFCFGQAERWTLTNNTAVQYSCYPAGMYFGGFWWGGGGGWTGTVESLFIQNNTIEGAHGQAFVIYDNGLVNRTPGVDKIHVDHNTFVNIIDWPKFYRHGNNTHWTNNLFVNLASNGQTRNAGNTNIAVNHPGGHGKTATLYQGACTDSTLLADGNCWDNTNRNIHYNNNAWMDTPELLDMFAMEPWCWDLPADSTGLVVTLCDTMLAGQSKWLGDSTSAQFANGVSETNNIHASDLGWNLDAAYITAQTTRTRDWLDNGVHDTHLDRFWMHQADGDNISVQWPLPMDFSYSATSSAATQCVHGGPVGSTHHMTHAADLSTSPAGANMPSAFALAQNYPNPFNPSTEISFTLNEAADVNLSIFNMLGQKVRTLTSGSTPAGVYSLEWDGRDEMGQSVSTGVYLYTLSNGSTSITKKMALMK